MTSCPSFNVRTTVSPPKTKTHYNNMGSEDTKERQYLSKAMVTGQYTIHSVIRRILKYASEFDPLSSMEEQKKFADTCTKVMGGIHMHHRTEEEYWFPVVSKGCGINLDRFYSDHKELDKSWSKINEKLAALRTSLESNESTDRSESISVLVALFKDMAEHMLPHLQAEEATITQDLLQKHYTVQQMKDIRRDMQEVVKRHAAESGGSFLTALMTPEELETMRRRIH